MKRFSADPAPTGVPSPEFGDTKLPALPEECRAERKDPLSLREGVSCSAEPEKTPAVGEVGPAGVEDRRLKVFMWELVPACRASTQSWRSSSDSACR